MKEQKLETLVKRVPLRELCLCGLLLWAVVAAVQSAQAMEPVEDDCFFICKPALTVFPSVVLQNLFIQPRIQSLADGQVQRLNMSAKFSTIFNLQIPTTIPRVSLVGRAIVVSFAEADVNPFTGYRAEELGVSSVDNNSPTLEFGVGFAAVALVTRGPLGRPSAHKPQSCTSEEEHGIS